LVYELQYKVKWGWWWIWVKAGVLQDENYLINPLNIQTVIEQLFLDRHLRTQSASAERRQSRKMGFGINQAVYDYQITNHFNPFNPL